MSVVLAQLCNNINTNVVPSYLEDSHVREISFDLSYNEFVLQFYRTQRFSTLRSTICLTDTSGTVIPIDPSNVIDISGNFDMYGDDTLTNFVLNAYVSDLSLNSTDSLSSCSLIHIYKDTIGWNCLNIYNHCCCLSFTRSEFDELYNLGKNEFTISLYITENSYNKDFSNITSVTKTVSEINEFGQTVTNIYNYDAPLQLLPIEIKLKFTIS